jgi:hypothetical protein
MLLIISWTEAELALQTAVSVATGVSLSACRRVQELSTALRESGSEFHSGKLMQSWQFESEGRRNNRFIVVEYLTTISLQH